MRNLLLAALAAALLAPAAAQASTKEVTVPASIDVLNGSKPTDPGNCDAVVMARFADVPNAVSWTVYATFDGVEGSQSASPPFNDHYEWVNVYDAPPGMHQVLLGKSWGDGPGVNDCSDLAAKYKAWYAPTGRVVVTVDTTACDTATAKAEKAAKAVAKARKGVRKAAGKPARKRATARLKAAKRRWSAATDAARAACA